MINGDDSITGFARTGGVYHKGLTKREEFAKNAMVGLLSNQFMIDDDSDTSIEWLVKTSVRISDVLIQELNKNKQL